MSNKCRHGLPCKRTIERNEITRAGLQDEVTGGPIPAVQ